MTIRQSCLYIVILYSVFNCFSYVMAQSVSLPPERPIWEFQIKNWTSNHGVPSNSVKDIIQTKDGYIWIASYGGLAKFDGLKFSVYSTRNVSSMLSYATQSIVQDSSDILWIATQRGILAYHHNTFVRPKQLQSIENLNIEKLFVDSRNRLWIGTNTKGVYCYADSILQRIDKPTNIGDVIMSIAEDAQHDIWFGAEGGNVWRYNHRSLEKQDFGFKGVFDISTDKKGTLWFGTTLGIYCYGEKKLTRPRQPSLRITNHILHDSYGYWIATIDGLYRYVQQSDTFFLHNEQTGLPNNIVNRLMYDNEGMLWGATYRQGIFQISDRRFTCYSTVNGTSSNMIVGIVQINDSTYWLANENTSIDILTKNIIHRNTQIPLQQGARLRDITTDRQNNIWISYYGGVRKISPANEQTFYSTANILPDNLVRLIHEDNQGSIWFATRSSGLYRMHNNAMINVGKKQGLSSDFIMCLSSDASGNLLAGTKQGINVIKKDTVARQYTIENGLPSNFIFSMYYDTDSILWIATNAGLSRFDGTNFFNINLKHGLIDDFVFDILEDRNNYFWLPSHHGIMYISRHSLNLLAQGKQSEIKCRVFDKNDGMLSEQCIGATRYYEDHKGNLWFPTISGLATINPDSVRVSTKQSKLFINEIVIDTDTLFFDQSLYISPDNKRTRIYYTALNYKAPEKITFRYKLEPLDKDWVLTQDRATLFAHLPAGNYVFHLSSINEDGVENPNKIVMNIIVPPHWWERAWIKILAILIAVVAISLWINAARLRAVRLEKMVKERTLEVEKQKTQIQLQANDLQIVNKKLLEQTQELQVLNSTKDKFFSILAHDLRNPIGSFKSATEMIADYYENFSADEMRSLASEMKYSAQALFVLLENLLEWSRMQTGHINYNPQIIDISNITRENLKLMSVNATQKNITIINHISQSLHVFADEHMINTVIRNLLSNALKFTNTGGVINIYAQQASTDKIQYYVADNGVGIAHEDISKLFRIDIHHTSSGTKQEKGSGLGLVLCKEFVEKNNGQISVESQIGKGTTFCIQLPSLQHA